MPVRFPLISGSVPISLYSILYSRYLGKSLKDFCIMSLMYLISQVSSYIHKKKKKLEQFFKGHKFSCLKEIKHIFKLFSLHAVVSLMVLTRQFYPFAQSRLASLKDQNRDLQKFSLVGLREIYGKNCTYNYCKLSNFVLLKGRKYI